MTTWPGGAWPTARAQGNAVVLADGDSVTSGQSATNYWTRSYAARLRASVRALYGDGGSGFSPHWTGATGGGVLSGAGTTSTVFASYIPNGHAVTLSGSARWTHQAEGTEVAVYFRRVTGYGTARWRVDEGDWQTGIVCDGTSGYIRTSADGLDPGTHTIDVEATSGTVAVAGTEGRNVTGSRLHIMGLGARTSGGNAFSSPTFEANAEFRAATIGRWAPHLYLVNVGVNDSNTATIDAATYKTNVEARITTARTARSDCDVILVANHLGKFANNGYDTMRANLVDLADTYGTLVVDLDEWARTLPDGTTTDRTAATNTIGQSWGRWATWGWLANGSDSVHPGDGGHHMIAGILSQVLQLDDATPQPSDDLIYFGGTG